MTSRPPFEFDISVKSDKAKRKTTRRGMSGAFETSNKGCDYPGCKEKGAYRAPKHPDILDQFFWFCRDHVREYNLKWNFFGTATDEEFQKLLEKDRLWERETKPFSKKDDGRAWQRLHRGERAGHRAWCEWQWGDARNRHTQKFRALARGFPYGAWHFEIHTTRQQLGLA